MTPSARTNVDNLAALALAMARDLAVATEIPATVLPATVAVALRSPGGPARWNQHLWVPQRQWVGLGGGYADESVDL